MEKDELVNIPRSVSDSHYRYKMPALLVKIEGRGNGIKTRLMNIVEIAKALDRPFVYLIKFLGFELGSQVVIKDDYLVSGKHEPLDLANLLDKFIDRYVLCGGCKNPETILRIHKELPRLRCKACGFVSNCDGSHKIANYMAKFPPEDPDSKKTEDNNDIFEIKIDEHTEEDDDWAVSTEPEAVARRQLALSGGQTTMTLNDEMTELSIEEVECSEYPDPPKKKFLEILKKITPTENPLPILAEYWMTCPDHSSMIFNLEKVSKFCNWTDEDLLRNIFASMWLPFKPEGAILKTRYLSLFIKSESHQKHVLRYMEKMATENKAFALRFADILAMFWEERVLEEDTIKKWYTHPNPKTPEKVSRFIREKSAPVIKWLNQSEEN